MGSAFITRGGIDTYDANATAASIRSGYSAYVKGQKVNGSIPKYTGSTNVTSNQTLATAGRYCPDNILINVPTSSGGGGDVTAASGVVTLSSPLSDLFLDQLGISIPDALKPSVKGFLVYLTGIEDTGVDVSLAGAIVSINCTFYRDNYNTIETESCYITYVDENGHIANTFYLPNQPTQEGQLEYCLGYYDYTYNGGIFVATDSDFYFAGNLPYQVVLYS